MSRTQDLRRPPSPRPPNSFRSSASASDVTGFVDGSTRVQRVLLNVIVVGAAVVLWRPTLDVFNLTKATFVLWGAIGLVAVGAARAIWTRRLTLPVSPVMWVIAAFFAALVTATAVSDNVALSVVGRWGRHTGLVMYLVYGSLLLWVLRLYTEVTVAQLTRPFLVALGLVALYGVVQGIGVDPLEWNAYGLRSVFSTLGNPNFASGYVGITLPIAVWCTLSGALGPRWRLFAMALVVIAPYVLIETESFQGPVAAAAGSAFVFLVWVHSAERMPPVLARLSPRVRLVAGAAAITLAACGGAAALGGFGKNVAEGLAERRYMWRTALAVFSDHPVFGSGLDTFINVFGRYRPAEHAARTGFGTVDNPHNVPLSMLSNGGLFLGVTYLALVGFTGWVLVSGLRRCQGERRFLVAGFGGAWLAYQVQSLVSFDLPPLALTHYVLAGAIIVLGAPPTFRNFTLPGTAVVRTRKKGGVLRIPSSTRWALGALSVAVVAALVITSRPLRADAAAGRANRTENPAEAIASFERAHRLAPWEAIYWLQYASMLEKTGRKADALRADERAAELESGNALYAVFAARLSKQTGDVTRAARWFREAVRRDPQNAALLLEAAGFEQEQGRPEAAVRILERAVKVRDDADTWLALAQARRAAGALDEARLAYERVLHLHPGHAQALQAVEQLRNG